MRLHAAIAAFLLGVAALSASGPLAPSPVDEARDRLAALPLHPVEGLWQIPGDDSVLEIVRDSVTSTGQVARYRIAVVTSSDLSIPAGTIVGTATPTAVYGIYDSRIFTEVEPARHLTPVAPRRCTLTLADDETRLLVKRYGRNVMLRWWRLLPYMWRWALKVDTDPAPDSDGLIRLYPESSTPQNPVYL